MPKPLDDYLMYVAKTGNTVFPWHHVRNLFRLAALLISMKYTYAMLISYTMHMLNCSYLFAE